MSMKRSSVAPLMDYSDREKRFYSSKAWRLKRKEVLKRDNYCCVECYKEGVITSNTYGLGASALHVHHKIPVRNCWETRLDSDNLVTLCNKHHALAHPEKLEKLQKPKKKEPEKKKLKNVKEYTVDDLMNLL